MSTRPEKRYGWYAPEKRADVGVVVWAGPNGNVTVTSVGPTNPYPSHIKVECKGEVYHHVEGRLRY